MLVVMPTRERLQVVGIPNKPGGVSLRDRAIGGRRTAERIITIGLLLLIAGCTVGAGDDSGTSGDSRHGGFYGGLTGGGSRL